METAQSKYSQIRTKLVYFWVALFAGLLVAHVLVSFHLGDLKPNGLLPAKPAPVPWDGKIPLAAKIAAAGLGIFLILILWRKTRHYAVNILMAIAFYIPLLLGYWWILNAYLAKDLDNYCESFTRASGALAICLLFFFVPFIRVLLNARNTKPPAPQNPAQKPVGT